MSNFVLDKCAQQHQQQLKNHLKLLLDDEKTILKNVDFMLENDPTNTVTIEYFIADSIELSDE